LRTGTLESLSGKIVSNPFPDVKIAHSSQSPLSHLRISCQRVRKSALLEQEGPLALLKYVVFTCCRMSERRN
jgi:hypothetical protein